MILEYLVLALVADGLFLRDPSAPPPTFGLQPQACHTFHTLPDALPPPEELFRAKVINLLVQENVLPPERVQVLYSWKHSGFNVHAAERIPPEAKADLENLAQCRTRVLDLYCIPTLTFAAFANHHCNCCNISNRPCALFNERLGFILGIVDTTDCVDTYGLVNPRTDFINLASSTDPTIPAHTDLAYVADPGLAALTTSRRSMRLP